jgi:hypothetical protein
MGANNELKENQEIIFQELPLPEESDAERAQNMQLFCDNLELIIANADLIMKRPEFFYIRHDWMLIGGIFVGSKNIPLGVLLKLWQSGRWIDECPGCGGIVYIFMAGGSPLSGSHYCHAVCLACRKIVNSKQVEAFTVLMQQAFDLCDRYSRKQKILRTRGPVFSWSKGLVGESVPVEILEDVVKPVSLAEMIEALKR